MCEWLSLSKHWNLEKYINCISSHNIYTTYTYYTSTCSAWWAHCSYEISSNTLQCIRHTYYTYMYMYTHIRTHTGWKLMYTYVDTYVNIRILKYTYMYISTYAYTYMRTYMYTAEHTHTYSYANIRTHMFSRAGYHQVPRDTILSRYFAHDNDNITIQRFCDNRYIVINFIHDTSRYLWDSKCITTKLILSVQINIKLKNKMNAENTHEHIKCCLTSSVLVSRPHGKPVL